MNICRSASINQAWIYKKALFQKIAHTKINTPKGSFKRMKLILHLKEKSTTSDTGSYRHEAQTSLQ